MHKNITNYINNYNTATMTNLNDDIYMECYESNSNVNINTVNIYKGYEVEQLKFKTDYLHVPIKLLRTFLSFKSYNILNVILNILYLYMFSSADLNIGTLQNMNLYQTILIKYPLPMELKTMLIFRNFFNILAIHLPYLRFLSISTRSYCLETLCIIMQKRNKPIVEENYFENYVMLRNTPVTTTRDSIISNNRIRTTDKSASIDILSTSSSLSTIDNIDDESILDENSFRMVIVKDDQLQHSIVTDDDDIDDIAILSNKKNIPSLSLLPITINYKENVPILKSILGKRSINIEKATIGLIDQNKRMNSTGDNLVKNRKAVNFDTTVPLEKGIEIIEVASSSTLSKSEEQEVISIPVDKAEKKRNSRNKLTKKPALKLENNDSRLFHINNYYSKLINQPTNNMSTIMIDNNQIFPLISNKSSVKVKEKFCSEVEANTAYNSELCSSIYSSFITDSHLKADIIEVNPKLSTQLPSIVGLDTNVHHSHIPYSQSTTPSISQSPSILLEEDLLDLSINMILRDSIADSELSPILPIIMKTQVVTIGTEDKEKERKHIVNNMFMQTSSFIDTNDKDIINKDIEEEEDLFNESISTMEDISSMEEDYDWLAVSTYETKPQQQQEEEEQHIDIKTTSIDSSTVNTTCSTHTSCDNSSSNDDDIMMNTTYFKDELDFELFGEEMNEY